MQSVRTLLASTIILAVIAGGGYFAYDWYKTDEFTEPSPPDKTKKPKKLPDDLGVTLPGDLKDQIQRDKEKQRTFFQRAVQAHTNGNFREAVELYRKTVAYSGADDIAANSYRYLGDIYERNEEYPRAIQLYRYAIQIKPKNSVFHYRLGRTYLNQGDNTNAAKEFDKAIERSPKAEYLLARGNIHLRQTELDDAIKTFNQGIETGKLLDKFYVNLGIAYEQAQQPESATDAYESALKQNMSSELTYRIAMKKGKVHYDLEQFQNALSAFKRAINHKETATGYYNFSLARYELGNITGATNALRKANSIDPDNPTYMTDLGFLYEELNNFDKSINWYTKTLNQTPENTDLYLALARVHEKNNQPREALKFYQELTRRVDEGPTLQLAFRRVGEIYLNTGTPENAAPAFRNVLRMEKTADDVHYNLGLAYRRNGELERAINQFRQALEDNPDHVPYLHALADTRYKAGFNRQALETYSRITELNSEHHTSHYMEALLQSERGNLDESFKKYQSLLEKTNSATMQFKIYQNIGNIYMSRNDLSKAQSAYRQSLEIQKHGGTYYNLGLVFARTGAWDKAANSFRLALKQDSQNPKFSAGLGMALYKKGLFREAKNYLEQALDRDPDNLRAQHDLKQVNEMLNQMNTETAGT